FPLRYRRVLVRPAHAGSSTMTELFRDGKSWVRIDDDPPVVTDADRPPRQSVAGFLDKLIDIRKENVPLRPLGETLVAGRKAVGIEARSKDWGLVELYFDKETALLVKLFRRLSEEPGSEATIEMIASDYQPRDGIPLPTNTRWYRDGKFIYEEKLTTVKF